MIKRLLKLPEHQSFFLFGARSTGKSTLIEALFDHTNSLWLDLLDPLLEDKFARDPSELRALVMGLSSHIKYVVIDEIQKVPKLLDVVHSLIEHTEKYFVMTGSSARKLKLGGADLLAGRAFVYHLFPFSFLELGEKFDLNDALNWGLLPKIPFFNTDEEKLRFLQAYALTYLKEEIWAEQLIKKMNPFRRFLEVAAQCNGKIINYANLSRDVGVDDKTIKEYFTILEDTLIGFLLEPFQHSFRKRLSLKPKFYFFDGGVVRALARVLSITLQPSTSAYGEAFEHFVILECIKLASYYQPEFRFSYLKTKDDVEVDLIVERPGQPLLFIEIKSSIEVSAEDLSTFYKLTKDFKNCEAVCFSRDNHVKRYDHVTVLPWQKGIKHYFYSSSR
jgi:predicted AAA+ superfamily ATPase